MTGDPQLVAVAGDWHANLSWATAAAEMAAASLDQDHPGLILHLGDFGFWPHDYAGLAYVIELDRALGSLGLHLLFIDGNHEDHNALQEVAAVAAPSQVLGLRIRDNISWLPRGTRWEWHGRRWLALGGAVSIDKSERKPEVSWFPQEAISPQQAQDAMAEQADVMLTHDCPAGVTLSLPVPPAAWLGQLNACEDHRQLLQNVVSAVQPAHLMHGHMHRCYSRPVRMPYGTCQVTGLACDGMDGNLAILDARTMQFR